MQPEGRLVTPFHYCKPPAGDVLRADFYVRRWRRTAAHVRSTIAIIARFAREFRLVVLVNSRPRRQVVPISSSFGYIMP